MYFSRFVVVSMTRFSIEIGMKGCDFHCRGARVNFGFSTVLVRLEDGKMANAMGETKRVCCLFEGSRVIRGEGSVGK